MKLLKRIILSGFFMAVCMIGFNYSESNASAAQKYVTGYNYLVDKDNNTGKNVQESDAIHVTDCYTGTDYYKLSFSPDGENVKITDVYAAYTINNNLCYIDAVVFDNSVLEHTQGTVFEDRVIENVYIGSHIVINNKTYKTVFGKSEYSSNNVLDCIGCIDYIKGHPFVRPLDDLKKPVITMYYYGEIIDVYSFQDIIKIAAPYTTQLSDYAFWDNKSLTDVEIGSMVDDSKSINIGKYSFYGTRISKFTTSRKAKVVINENALSMTAIKNIKFGANINIEGDPFKNNDPEHKVTIEYNFLNAALRNNINYLDRNINETYEPYIDIKELDIQFSAQEYSGEELKPVPVAENIPDICNFVQASSDKPASGAYYIKYNNNVNAGVGQAVITGTNNLGTGEGVKYTGEVTVNFTIKPYSLSNAEINLTENEFIFDGNEKCPEVVICDSNMSPIRGLTPDDYIVSYENNISAGRARVIIEGKNNLAGSTEAVFIIAPKSVSESDTLLQLKQGRYIYDGTRKVPTVYAAGNGNELGERDIEIIYEKDCVNSGTKHVTVNGIGNYTGTVILEYIIEPLYLSNKNVNLKISDDYSDYKYNGKEKRPGVVICYAGYELEYVYDDIYLEYINNIGPGLCTIHVKGNDTNVRGAYDLFFNITPENTDNNKTTGKDETSGGNDITGKGDGDIAGNTHNNQNGSGLGKDDKEVPLQRVYLRKASIKKLKFQNNKRTVKVKIKKTANTDGYIIYRSMKKKKGYKLIGRTDKYMYADNNVKYNKTYYYKVRAFQYVDGRKVYGKYSEANRIKTAKRKKKKQYTESRYDIKPEITVTGRGTMGSSQYINIKWGKIDDKCYFEVKKKDDAKNIYRTVRLSNNRLSYYSDNQVNILIPKVEKAFFKMRLYKKQKNKKIYGPYSNVECVRF